jgi:hypothetical protein
MHFQGLALVVLLLFSIDVPKRKANQAFTCAVRFTVG